MSTAVKKERPVGNALILCAITLVAGLLLSFVNQLTIEPIAAAQLKAKAEAYTDVFPNAASFEAVEESEDLLTHSSEWAEGAGYAGGYVSDVMRAVDGSGGTLGYVFSADSKNGYGGNITVALGIDTSLTITGFKPLAHSETPGFGARCEEGTYRAQFPGKTSADELDGISGATFTTNAIRQAVGAALTVADELMNAEGGV